MPCLTKRASAGTVGRRSAVRPPSSGLETRPRSCSSSGIVTSIVALDVSTPGRRSRAKPRRPGNARLSAASAGDGAWGRGGGGQGGAQRAGQPRDSGFEVVILAREGPRRDAEVRDQVL